MKLFIEQPNANTKIICVGLNFTDHAKEQNAELPANPVFFTRFPSGFVKENEALVAPKASTKFDYEVELVVVIGKTAHHVPESQALDYVYGYTVANDGSLRDYQKKSHQWTLGKNFDKSASILSTVVPKEKLPEGAKGLKMTAKINGKLLQNGNTSDMIFGVAKLIADLTEVMTLNPGDVILTGTPAGVGMAQNPHLWMKPGDVVEMEIEKIGVLKNTVIAEA
jgi:2-keto-4-pentenoate hydratase/2-oxohepta-3-ene-1,7-dioic acid hydratase in catechol pathway